MYLSFSLSFFKIQYALLDTLYEAEKAISTVADKPESLTANMETGSESELKSIVANYRDNAEFLKGVILTFGDSLAWSLLSREFIRGSIDKNKGGNITFRSGFDAEIETLKKIEKKKDTFAVLCDVTHCLGISDIIAIKPHEIKLIEVKSSSYSLRDYNLNGDKRLEKQINKMNWLGKYSSVEEGELPVPKGYANNFQRKYYKRIDTNIKDSHYFKELDKVILRAKKGESRHAYVILDNTGLLIAYYEKDYKKSWIDHVLLKTGLSQKGDRLILGCLNRHVLEFPDILPIPLFDISRSSRYELISQNVSVCVIYPINKLIQLFSSGGINATWEEGGLMLSKKGNDHTFRVLPYQLNRMLYELLTPESLVNIMSVTIDKLNSM